MAELIMAYDRWHGLIPFCSGFYLTLLVYGHLRPKKWDPEKFALWQRKFGGLMKVLAPLVPPHRMRA